VRRLRGGGTRRSCSSVIRWGVWWRVGIWIVLWATGAKAFDGFLVAMVIITLAATVRILKPYLPGRE